MLDAPALQTALSTARLTAVHGPWSRVVALRHLLRMPVQPLWSKSAAVNGARFTPIGGFDSLYFAWDATTALAEVQALAFLTGSRFQPLTPPWVVMSVDGVVSGVLDLTHPATLAALGTNEQEISGPWQTSASPPTQRLAQAVFDTGRMAGIKYPSARNTGGGLNLVVFPDRLPLVQTDYLEVFDPHGHLTQRIGV